jgi:hypothetical protein
LIFLLNPAARGGRAPCEARFGHSPPAAVAIAFAAGICARFSQASGSAVDQMRADILGCNGLASTMHDRGRTMIESSEVSVTVSNPQMSAVDRIEMPSKLAAWDTDEAMVRGPRLLRSFLKLREQRHRDKVIALAERLVEEERRDPVEPAG